ncbi:MAG TPA: hypothetical protein VF881_10505 [Polyangiaceae bacterium]
MRVSFRCALAVAFAFLGCRSTALQQGPSDTLRAYSRALDEGHPDDAYKLLSSEARRSISPDAFRRMVKENAPEMKDIAHALSRPSSDPVVTATVTSPKGETILLVYEEGRWRLDGSAINLYGQSTPRQSIEAFLRAFERKRFDVLLRFVPDAHMEGLDAQKLRAAWEGAQKEEMLRITSALRAALPTAQFEEIGDRATMAYGSGGTVQLVREHGAWKIEDFD